ncbi:MAG TPA: hypothetical protein VF681_03640 [Abditibacteriaceae bacterium]|jgi:predicted RNase H-like nuclease (RuvC/YqgF family)
MGAKDILSTLSAVLKTYHTIEQSLEGIDKSVESLTDEFKLLRGEHMKMEGRIACLEESRKTVSAEVRADMAEHQRKVEGDLNRVVRDLQIDFIKTNLQFQSMPRERDDREHPDRRLPSASAEGAPRNN